MISESEGSLTVEAFLIMPVILLLLALFLRWGLMLRDDLRDTAARGRAAPIVGTSEQGERPELNIGFLFNSQPARRIRDTDFLIDMAYNVKEKVSEWLD